MIEPQPWPSRAPGGSWRPMSRRTALPALAVALTCAAALSGCLTPRVQPALSQAVVQAQIGRAHV